MNLVPVPLTPETQFRVSIEIFEEAMKKAEERSQRVRLLLISNPENPLGIVHSADTLRALCEWSSSHGLHTLVDEVYANCLHHRKEANFSSIASVFTAEEMREKEVYALSFLILCLLNALFLSLFLRTCTDIFTNVFGVGSDHLFVYSLILYLPFELLT